MFHFADLTVAQVAEETGASVAAVKQQLVRGRAAMASILADQPAGDRADSAPPKGAVIDD